MPHFPPIASWLAPLRKAVVLVAGILILIAGVLMLVLPGPGIVAILFALGLLSTEFAWAKRARVWAAESSTRFACMARSSRLGRWAEDRAGPLTKRWPGNNISKGA